MAADVLLFRNALEARAAREERARIIARLRRIHACCSEPSTRRAIAEVLKLLEEGVL